MHIIDINVENNFISMHELYYNKYICISQGSADVRRYSEMDIALLFCLFVSDTRKITRRHRITYRYMAKDTISMSASTDIGTYTSYYDIECKYVVLVCGELNSHI